MINFDKPSPNMAAAIALFEQQTPHIAKVLGWEKFKTEMWRISNRFPRTDLVPEEMAHVWLDACGKPVPDPTCGRGK